MLNNMLVHGLDPSTRRPQEIEVVGNALKVYLASLLSGEDQFIGALGTIPAANEYVEGSGAAGDIVLGSTGAVGDFLADVRVRAAAVGGTVTVTVKDGSTTLDSFTHTFADNTTNVFAVNRRSKNGGWKITLAVSAGTLANAKYGAAGSFS